MSSDDIIANLGIPTHSLINDYVEGSLNDEEKHRLERGINCCDALSAFVDKSSKGKQLLSAHHFRVTAADDFEDKLFKRIREKTEEHR